jgi:hypothetical protein
MYIIVTYLLMIALIADNPCTPKQCGYTFVVDTVGQKDEV